MKDKYQNNKKPKSQNWEMNFEEESVHTKRVCGANKSRESLQKQKYWIQVSGRCNWVWASK